MSLHSPIIFSVVTALGLVGIIALQVIVPVREAEAKECNNIISFNASKGSCFHTWLGGGGQNRSMNVETGGYIDCDKQTA